MATSRKVEGVVGDAKTITENVLGQHLVVDLAC